MIDVDIVWILESYQIFCVADVLNSVESRSGVVIYRQYGCYHFSLQYYLIPTPNELDIRRFCFLFPQQIVCRVLHIVSRAGVCVANFKIRSLEYGLQVWSPSMVSKYGLQVWSPRPVRA